MLKKYIHEKYMMPIKEVEFIYVIFSNGSHIELRKEEIIDFDFAFYDELIMHNDEFIKKAFNGYITLDISNRDNKFKRSLEKSFEVGKRKQEIENILLNDNNVTRLRFFNENNYSEYVQGNFVTSKKGDKIKISAVPDTFEHNHEEKHFFVKIPDYKIDDILSINFDFENCEHFTIYNDEIKEYKLNFNEKLLGGVGFNFKRQLKGGYIKVKLNYTCNRSGLIFVLKDEEGKYEYGDEAPTTKERIIKRLKIYGDEHNICHLYIRYNGEGYGTPLEECISIRDIRDIDFDKISDDELDEMGWFVGGHVKILSKDTFIIFFE